jgi:hypothetical protein
MDGRKKRLKFYLFIIASKSARALQREKKNTLAKNEGISVLSFY